MIRKKHTLDQIDAFLLNRLSASKITSFQNELERNDQIRTLFVERKHLMEGIRYHSLLNLLDDVEKWDTEIPVESNPEQNQPASNDHSSYPDSSEIAQKSRQWKLLRRSVVAGIAASVTLIFLISFFQANTRKEKLVTAYFEHYPSNVSATRSIAPGEYSVLKERAYNLYNIGEYELAAPLLEEVAQLENDEVSILFAAISYIGSGEIEKAKSLLTQYLSDHPGDPIAVKYQQMIFSIEEQLK